MTEPRILLVTCCMERSRYEVLKQVMQNIREECPPEWRDNITVFDNASTFIGAGELLTTFSNVYRSDKNVGYWSAVDWWLQHVADESPQPVDSQTFWPKYTYIIESDNVHYDAHQMPKCVDFLEKHPELGSMRMHQYSIENFRLYNKDVPLPQSKRNLWQSHTNKVTGKGVAHHQVDGRFWRTNFLTQLPALNRFEAMKQCFDELRSMGRFNELDFQRLYHDRYPDISILDGGMFHCDLNPYGTPDSVTGSWTNPQTLKQLGYVPTRISSIVPRDQYTVQRLA